MENTKTQDHQGDALWLRIENYVFDEPGAAAPFSAKLTREQGWQSLFTERVLTEYRRFIYLCCISPTGASPSQTVDEAWHMHLTYTVDYWQRFCRDTLQRDIHHHPSAGGAEEKDRHRKWYRQTLKLYADTFGEQPPHDIWPPLPAVEILPVPVAVPPNYFITALNGWWALLLLPPALIVALYRQPDPFRLTGPHFLLFYAMLLTATFIITAVALHTRQRRLELLLQDNLASDPRCEVAYLKGEADLFFHEADLVKAGVLIPLDEGHFSIERQLAQDNESPLAPALAAFPGPQIPVAELQLLAGEVQAALQVKYKPVQQSFDEVWPAMILPALVLLMGVARMIQGIHNERPVMLLFALLVVSFNCFRILFASCSLTGTCRYIFRGAASDDIAGRLDGTQVALMGIVGLWLAERPAGKGGDGGGCGGGGCGGGGCGGGCGGCGGS